MSKLAVCIPSRGLIHARTLESVMRELEGAGNWRLFTTYDLPIPDCFNSLTEQAIEWGADLIWFVEEDMLLERGTLSALLRADAPLATVNYPVSPTGTPVVQNGTCGTGCTLIQTKVLKEIKTEEGYFRSNVSYMLPDWTPFTPQEQGYGQHDIDLCMRLKKAGYIITVVGRPAAQLRVVQYGQSGTNNGTHEVTVWQFA